MKITRKVNLHQAEIKGPLRWWGRLRFMYGHAVFYVGAIQLTLIAAMAYNTTVQPWVAQYLGWNIAFWQYCLILAIILLVGMVMDFMFGVPALIAVANEQQYKHESPIKRDLAVVKKNLSKIMENLGIEEETE